MKIPSLLQMCGAAAVALLPLSATFAQADGATAAKQRPSIDERLAKMKTNLDLTDDQVAKIKAIFEGQKAAADPIWKDTSLSKEQRREKLKPLMDDTKTKVEAVLTPDQQAKMKAAREKKKDKKD